MVAQRIKPQRLRAGDTVGVVAPGAALEPEYLERGVNALTALGYRVKVSRRALNRSGILAGSDRERAEELAAFFADPQVRALFVARGGYGCGRLLPLLDFDALARTPKPFVGFSDATFLLTALVERAGMVAFHGPMVAMDLAHGLSARSQVQLTSLLAGRCAELEFEARQAVWPGRAEGELIGGCLSVLIAMLGTPYAPDFKDKILFLEDGGEKAYRVDRMLVQLKQAGALAALKGLVFGAIKPVDGSPEERQLIASCIAEQTAELGRPVLYGIEVGHGSENLTLPLGVKARIDAGQRKLTIIESAVS